MRRWVTAFLIFVFCGTAAQSQSGKHIVLLSGVPSWVLRAGGVPAAIDDNFAIGQYYGCGLSCYSVTRASSKTDLLHSSASGAAYNTFGNNVLAITPGLGLLVEEARTNQLLNSAVPATQTTGSLANGAYTLWVNGSGTATMSAGTATGCGTGVASQGTPVNFTTSGAAGTCTVTVAGSLNAFQLELGAFGTSLIVTAGATATRAADNIAVTGALLSRLISSSVSVLPTTKLFQNTVAGTDRVIFSQNGTGLPESLYVASGGTNLGSYNGSVFLNKTATGATWTNITKSGLARDGSGRSVTTNNQTVASDANTFPAATLAFLGSYQGTSAYLNGYLARFSAWNFRIPNATLQGLTSP